MRAWPSCVAGSVLTGAMAKSRRAVGGTLLAKRIASGIVRDPFGHHWSLCTRREQLAPDEVAARVPVQPVDGSWAG